jgi:hypothetical protein
MVRLGYVPSLFIDGGGIASTGFDAVFPSDATVVLFFDSDAAGGEEGGVAKGGLVGVLIASALLVVIALCLDPISSFFRTPVKLTIGVRAAALEGMGVGTRVPVASEGRGAD